MNFKLIAIDTKKVFQLSWLILPLIILVFGIISYFTEIAWLMIGCIPIIILVVYWVISTKKYTVEITFSNNELQINQTNIPYDQILRYTFDDDSVLTENVTFHLKNQNKITLVVSTEKQNKIVFDALKKYLEEKVNV